MRREVGGASSTEELSNIRGGKEKVIAVKGYKHLIDFETSSGNCTSRPREIALACLEMKMIGKPYAGELHVRFDEGEQDCVSGTILHEHEAGNGGDSQEST